MSLQQVESEDEQWTQHCIMKMPSTFTPSQEIYASVVGRLHTAVFGKGDHGFTARFDLANLNVGTLVNTVLRDELVKLEQLKADAERKVTAALSQDPLVQEYLRMAMLAHNFDTATTGRKALLCIPEYIQAREYFLKNTHFEVGKTLRKFRDIVCAHCGVAKEYGTVVRCYGYCDKKVCQDTCMLNHGCNITTRQEHGHTVFVSSLPLRAILE